MSLAAALRPAESRCTRPARAAREPRERGFFRPAAASGRELRLGKGPPVVPVPPPREARLVRAEGGVSLAGGRRPEGAEAPLVAAAAPLPGGGLDIVLCYRFSQIGPTEGQFAACVSNHGDRSLIDRCGPCPSGLCHDSTGHLTRCRQDPALSNVYCNSAPRLPNPHTEATQSGRVVLVKYSTWVVLFRCLCAACARATSACCGE